MINEPQREALRLSPEEARLVERLQRYREDLPLHGVQCLKIVDKKKLLVPMHLNKPQLFLHARLEAQRRAVGMARALVLKGRKQGISTYIGGRFYSKARLWRHQSAKVMAHDQASTDTMFSMVQTMYDNDSLHLRADTSNAKAYKFSNGSSYSVATAGGSGEAGRGDTPNLAHLSEAAFYKNPEKTFAGFVNSIPTEPGTEILVESTANGVGNEFHRRWLRAEKNEVADGDQITFIPVFIPWFLSDEYRLPVPSSFELIGEPEGENLLSEREIAEMYGLDMPQMAWRRYQRDEVLGGVVEKFMQEYPCTAAEAFQATTADVFIKPMWLARARRREGIQPYGPKILGIDPSGGVDGYQIAMRQGHVIPWYRKRRGLAPEDAVHWVASVVEEVQPDRVNVDNGGGWGAMLLMGIRTHYPKLAHLFYPVDFGGTSQFKTVNPHRPGPRNRRAEMAMRLRDWLMAPEGSRIPDDGELQSDCAAIEQHFAGQVTDILLESKKEIKKRLGHSPDCFDACILTFAAPDSTIDTPLTDTAPSAMPDVVAGLHYPPVAAEQGRGGWGRDSGSWMG